MLYASSKQWRKKKNTNRLTLRFFTPDTDSFEPALYPRFCGRYIRSLDCDSVRDWFRELLELLFQSAAREKAQMQFKVAGDMGGLTIVFTTGEAPADSLLAGTYEGYTDAD